MVSSLGPCDLDEVARKSGKSREEVEAFLALIQRSMEPHMLRIAVVEGGAMRYHNVERRGVGLIQTKYGPFWLYTFMIDDCWEKYSVLVRGQIDRTTLMPMFSSSDQLVLRTDSGCETGQLFGDLTCECDDQLRLAMQTIADTGEGMIVNIPRQDGRGMGLPFKLATLWLQEELGVNTVESATMLAPGGVIDVRTYSGVICILKFFGILETCTIALATSNPAKVSIFGENGYTVASEFVSVIVPTTAHTERHLKAKREHLGHVCPEAAK